MSRAAQAYSLHQRCPMTPSRPNVVIATPCYGGLMTHVYVNSLLKLMGSKEKQGFGLGLFAAAHDSLITRSRNALVKSFLDATAATHLLFIDADIGFEPSAVLRLLQFDVEVAAGMYPLKVVDWARIRSTVGPGTTEETLRESGLHFVGVPCTDNEREERGGFVTGQYAGTGFMMIQRSAIERMVAAYPETAYRAMHTYPVQISQGAPYYNLFDCMIHPENGAYLSEDFAFCHRFRKLGGKVWLDTTSRLTHVGSMEFAGNAAAEMTKYGVALSLDDHEVAAAE
jgi:hypothetical protein